MAGRRRNLFRMSRKELEEWQEHIRSSEGQNENYESRRTYEQFYAETHVAVERDVPCPYPGPVEEGTIVYATWRGIPAWWLNGTLYVRTDRYEQYKQQHPEE